jgi:hypothetical protein
MPANYPPDDIPALLEGLRGLLYKAGEDDQGVEIDIDHAIGEVSPLFSESMPRAVKDAGVLTWSLEWHGQGNSVSAVNRDFHRLLGEFGEETEFLSHFVEASSVRYEVVLGSLRGHQHVHHVRFVIGGPKIATICSEWRRIGESLGLST